MKRVWVLIGVCLLSAAAFAATLNVPAFPGTLRNARYVYVTSYDGNQFDYRILPEDRQAIANVQNAVQAWGRYIVVYRPEQADIILAVQSRGSEDILAVYDARDPGANYLWRVTARDGLEKGETPLVTELQHAVEKMEK